MEKSAMKEPKAKITVSVDVSLIVWIDEKVKEGIFKSRSEGIQRCIGHAQLHELASDLGRV